MFYNENIKLARESRGLSQSELASDLHITQASLSKMEKGLLDIKQELIVKLSEILRYPISFFSKDFSLKGEDTFFYRKRQSMRVKDLSILESRISILSKSIDELLDSVEIPPLTIPSCQVNANCLPEEIAFKIRAFLSLPKGPVDNIVSILEKNGVIVVFINIKGLDKFDGLTKFTANNAPVIWINSCMPNDRKRYTIAHELGHLVMHLRTLDTSKSEEEKEEEANRFAAEFLLPKEECLVDLFNLKYNELPLKKMYWKVSKASLIYRAYQLHCISKSTEKYLYVTLGRNGERKHEEGFVSIDKPSILAKMVNLHMTELNYSLDELSKIVGICDKEIKEDLLGEKATPKIIALFKRQ